MFHLHPPRSRVALDREKVCTLRAENFSFAHPPLPGREPATVHPLLFFTLAALYICPL
jgi:hypothetical protein